MSSSITVDSVGMSPATVTRGGGANVVMVRPPGFCCGYWRSAFMCGARCAGLLHAELEEQSVSQPDEGRVATVAGPVEVDGEIQGDLTVDQHRRAICEKNCLVDVMGHQQDGRPMAHTQVLQQHVHPNAGQRVQCPEGLVEQHQLRLPHEGAGQGHPLRLATGKGQWPVVGVLAESDLSQGVEATTPQRNASTGAPAQPEQDVDQHSLPRYEARLLEDHSPALGNQHLPLVVGIETTQDAQQGALSCSASTEERDEFIAPDRQVKAPEDVPAVEAPPHPAGHNGYTRVGGDDRRAGGRGRHAQAPVNPRRHESSRRSSRRTTRSAIKPRTA